MAVEETFHIRVADSEAEKIRTPRHLIDTVWRQVVHADSTTCLSHRAFNQFRRLLMHRSTLSRKVIVPAAGLADLLSRSERRELAGYLAADLGTGEIRLMRPKWLTAGIFTSAVGIGVAATLPLQPLSAGISVLIAATVAATAGFLFAKGTGGFRTEFPKALSSVGDLSAWIVAHKPDLATGLPSQKAWTREQVAWRVREIVVEHLGCDAEYHEDALFVEDLGLV